MNIQPADSPGLDLKVLRTDTDRRFLLLVFAIFSISLYIFSSELISLPLSPEYTSCINKFLANPLANGISINGLPYSCSWQPDLILLLGLLTGEVAVFGVAFLLYWFLPIWKCRRKRLVPLEGAEMRDVIRYLEDLRLQHIPNIRLRYVWNSKSGAYPLVFGRLGKYYLFLSGKFVTMLADQRESVTSLTEREKCRAILLHEISHLCNKDVNRSYFTVTVWYAFVLVALLSYVVLSFFVVYISPAAGDAFTLSGIWRVAVLVVLAYLIRASVLRSREVYADIRSTQLAGSASGLGQALDRVEPGQKRFNGQNISRLFRLHPDQERRRSRIGDPYGAFHLKFGEALGIGIAFGMAFPSIYETFNMITQLLSARILAIGYSSEYPDIGTLFLCSIVVFIIWHMIWHAMLAARVRGKEFHGTGRIGLCLAAGLVLGLFLSPAFTPLTASYQVTYQVFLFYFVPWLLLLALGLSGFCRWLELLASLWLDAVSDRQLLGRVPWMIIVIASLLLAVGLALFSLFVQATAGFLLPPGDQNLTSLTHPIMLQAPASIGFYWLLLLQSFLGKYLQRFYLCFALAGLWALPLIVWFWYCKSVPGRFRWAVVASIQRKDRAGPQTPFRLRSVGLISLVGGLIFCVLLLAIHQGLLFFVGVPALTPYATAIVFAQFALAALFQVAVAAIIMLRVQRARIVNGLFGAFLSGCLMATGMFGVYLIFGGVLGAPIGPDSFRPIFLYEVNWGAVGALLIGILMSMLLFRPRSQLQPGSVSRPKSYARRKWYLLTAILCVLVIGVIVFPRLIPGEQNQAGATSANIVKNGDFESPIVIGTFQEYNVSQSFEGWTVASGSVDLISTYWIPAHGAQSVDLDGADAGAIYQNLPTRAGASYSLSFALAGNPVCAPDVKKMEVWWGPTPVATLSFNITGHSNINMGWQYHSYRLRSTETTTSLKFVSLTQSLCGPALDDVVVRG